MLDAHEGFVVGLMEGRKDVTLDEMVELLFVKRQVKISRSALGAWLRGRGGVCPSRRALPSWGATWESENDDLHRSIAPHGNDRTVRL